jgi:hypothetical protein
LPTGEALIGELTVGSRLPTGDGLIGELVVVNPVNDTALIGS